jgi:hypothetical protein
VNGEWENEKMVMEEFYRMFEERIKLLFVADNENQE